MRVSYLLFLSFFLFISCTADNGSATGDEQSFDAFYDSFLSDSSFQMNHIQFPLAGRSSAYDQHSDDFRWQKSDWRIHRPIDSRASGFKSSFSKISDEFIIEKIILNNGAYGMERRFSKFGTDGWYLIYYADLHPIANAG